MLPAVNRQHDDCFLRETEIDRIRKARQDCPAGLVVDARKGKWAGRDTCNQDVECLAEFSPKPRTPRLVPPAHFKRFVLSLGPEDDFERHS